MNNIELLIGLKLAEGRIVEDESIRRRDREFGLREDVKHLPDSERIENWFNEPFNDDVRNEASRYSNSLNLFSWLASAIFFLIGMGAAGLAFYYEGERPINVLPILLLFVIIPFGLLLFSMISQLTRTYLKPGSGESRTILFWESMLGMVAARFSHRNRKRVDSARRFFKQFVNAHGELVRTFVLKTIQKAGIAYVLGALLWVLVNVITTDLAFSWSSTVNMGPQHMHAITETIAAPWKGWLAGATVDYETIENTRYFRAWQGPIPEGASVYDLGGWWAFLLMSLVTYSLLPRLAAFAFFNARLHKKAGSAITESQEGQTLLQRMDTPFIHTGNGENDNARDWEDAYGGGRESIDSKPESCILMWNFGEYDFDVEKVMYRFGIHNADIYALGGVNTIAEDDKIIDRVSSAFKGVDHKQHLIILVEYWESADVDFEKMLKKLRAAIGQKLIRIIPVALHKSDVKETNMTNWMNKIEHIGDPLIRFDHDSRIIISD